MHSKMSSILFFVTSIVFVFSIGCNGSAASNLDANFAKDPATCPVPEPKTNWTDSESRWYGTLVRDSYGSSDEAPDPSCDLELQIAMSERQLKVGAFKCSQTKFSGVEAKIQPEGPQPPLVVNGKKVGRLKADGLMVFVAINGFIYINFDRPSSDELTLTWVPPYSGSGPKTPFYKGALKKIFAIPRTGPSPFYGLRAKPEVRHASSGANFIQDCSVPGMGQAYRAPNGLIWSEAFGVMSYPAAAAKCESMGARVPSMTDALQMHNYFSKDNVTDDYDRINGGAVLPGMFYLFWTSDLGSEPDGSPSTTGCKPGELPHAVSSLTSSSGGGFYTCHPGYQPWGPVRTRCVR